MSKTREERAKEYLKERELYDGSVDHYHRGDFVQRTSKLMSDFAEQENRLTKECNKDLVKEITRLELDNKEKDEEIKSLIRQVDVEE